jgi:hypothetical protein
MAERKRKYQDVYDLLKQNPELSIAEAGRQLGYERELGDKGQGRIGPKHRPSDAARVSAEAAQRGDAPRSKPPIVSGMDRHHKRMIMLYRPLFEGLSKADALALSKHAASRGMNLGDVEANFEYLSKKTHNKVHRYMEQQGMRPSLMPDFSKADLTNRKKAFDVLYKDFIQADIDKFLAEQKKGVSKERKSLQVNTDDDFGASKSRIARNLAVGPLSIAAGMMATAQQAQATIRNPSQENLYNLGFDAANTLTDAVGLFPPAAGISEGVQRGLSFAQMGYNATRSLKIKPPK